MIYGYCRVSTARQMQGNSFEEQEQALRAEGAQEIVRESYTGTKLDRPLFDVLLSKLKEGDTLMVTKLDRFARNTLDGVSAIQELINRGINVRILNMGMVDNSPMGKLIVTVLAAIAEFERDMIVERTQSGKAIRKANDPSFKDGRPNTYTTTQINHAMDLLDGYSYTQVSEMTGISVSTLQRAKRKRTLRSS